MREIKVILRELKTGEKAVDLDYPDNLGKRTKLGGEPEWIQDDETPSCKSCDNPMRFVGQIDSIDYTGDINPAEEYMFGDVGLIYVFFCLECTEATAVVQCY